MNLPNYLFDEMLKITKVFHERHPADSKKHLNAIRRGSMMYRKLNKISSNLSKDFNPTQDSNTPNAGLKKDK